MESLYFSPMLLGLNLMLASAVACTGLWYFSRPYRGPGFWMAGAWLLILGIFSFFVFVATGNRPLNVFGNATQLAGEAVLMLGVFRFLDRPLPWWTVPVSAGLMAAANSWHWWVAPLNSELLIAIYAGIGGLLPLQAAGALLRHPRDAELRVVCRCVGIVLLGYALVTLLRGGIAVHDWLNAIEHPDVTRSMAYLLPYNFAIPLWVIALVGLALMTMRRILLDSQRNARQAEASAQRFERLMNVTRCGMLVLQDGRIQDSNPTLGALFGQSREGLLQQTPEQLFVDAERARIGPLLTQADGTPADVTALRRDGSTFPAELSVTHLDGAGQQLLEVRDVSHRKALEERLRLQATTDPLTGALNRRAFYARAEHELQRARRQGQTLCLAMLDLDHFKRINDAHGHGSGDRVLCEFSRLCQHEARSTDLFARFGGEEFVFLLPDTTPDAARNFLERLRESVEQLRVDANGISLRVSVSIGLAASPPNADLHLLQEAADAALYRAKQHGRNRVELAL
ncbi:GGDEF domain-containing protein [Pseudomonas sp. TUM22785]|uniref:GGDEF domain-containing protein n=1 Tax=Pseudomonas sp. TUM22785 TaxID=3019098 RepID=UPI0023050680|nr:sensor domain-containing diguanylate cyclase [Pseudomonas sp. TUM22785]WCD80382.1 sensor domain-containing diguanylate cyclase [Pseudomonas sp. TUM22785]